MLNNIFQGKKDIWWTLNDSFKASSLFVARASAHSSFLARVDFHPSFCMRLRYRLSFLLASKAPFPFFRKCIVVHTFFHSWASLKKKRPPQRGLTSPFFLPLAYNCDCFFLQARTTPFVLFASVSSIVPPLSIASWPLIFTFRPSTTNKKSTPHSFFLSARTVSFVLFRPTHSFLCLPRSAVALFLFYELVVHTFLPVTIEDQ